jgi:hypothetical protein
MEHFENELTFVRSIEENLPLIGHSNFHESWKTSVLEFREEIPEPVQTCVLEAILDFRCTFLDAAIDSHKTIETVDHHPSYTWLLTTKQVPQRTTEWYDETVNILTASELSNLWKGPRSRAALVYSKVKKEEIVRGPPRLACKQAETSAMDWGVRYEPVVKQVLGYTIEELGRIRHRTNNRLAASPDGLITSPGEYEGCLVEIKCPTTRPIEEKIPFDYWCQMQIQMEVCDRPSCLYVECKWKEVPFTDSTTNWISLDVNTETMELRYRYSPTLIEEGWTSLEQYGWELVQMRKTLVQRDTQWFQTIQPDLTQFWNDVESAREGTWNPILPPPRKKKVIESLCAIVDISGEEQT